MSGPWHLVDAIPPLLRAQGGITDDQLAEELDAPQDEIRAAVAILRNRGLVDQSWDGQSSWVVLAPATPGQEGVA
jgi:transcription initiation factor IIE alpha subunit